MTPRERQVAECVARGLSNKEIARELWVSLSTVKFHISGIYAKLGFTRRAELIRWFLTDGDAQTYETEPMHERRYGGA